MYRGYLTQFVRRYTANPIAFIGVPAMIFAAMHIANIAAFGGTGMRCFPTSSRRCCTPGSHTARVRCGWHRSALGE